MQSLVDYKIHRFPKLRLSYFHLHHVRTIFFLLATLVLPFAAAHAQYYAVKSDSGGVRVEVPAAVVASFKKVFPLIPRDTLVQWEVFDEENHPNAFYGVTLGKHGDYGKAAFDSVGYVGSTLLEVPLNGLPKPVQRKMKKQVFPWLKKSFPHMLPNLRAYAYTVEGVVEYYVIDFKNTVVPRRSRDWLIQPDGNSYPRGAPVFR